MLKNKGGHTDYCLSNCFCLINCVASIYVFTYFNKLLRLFSIFMVKYKEIKGGSRVLHNTVHLVEERSLKFTKE